ncbi:MAG: hypothetical protein IT353_06660 [Gemmatimonadaceae bacterium]|nr:hypothetical protein [Gemmatimonadaceae bacterium]
MKATVRCLLLATFLLPQLSRAQTASAAAPNIGALIEAVGRARTALSGVPALWGFDASDVQWIFTDGSQHLASARREGRDTVHVVTLPAGTTIANTAVTVDGKRWAMIVLDLTRTEGATVSLLVHEAMHTFQPDRLPAPGPTEAGVGGDLLDGADGRAWLFLELRALAIALTTTGSKQQRAAHDALLFRARRDALAVPTERRRLEVLDQIEGIPEYTGLRLDRITDASLATRLQRADTLDVGWVRSVAYYTGPAYGFLLDRLGNSTWRAKLRNGTPLPTLLRSAIGADASDVRAASRVSAYGGEDIFRAERARARINARRLDALRTRFLRGPVLRVVPGSLQISFDPNGQTPIGADGTVMTNFRWTTPDGAEFVAAKGALVSPQWDWFQSPLDGATSRHPKLVNGTLGEALTLQTADWRLHVPAGWRIVRQGSRIELRPPAR